MSTDNKLLMRKASRTPGKTKECFMRHLNKIHGNRYGKHLRDSDLKTFCSKYLIWLKGDENGNQ